MSAATTEVGYSTGRPRGGPSAPVDTFADTYGPAQLRAVFAAVDTGDRGRIVDAVDGAARAPQATDLLYYVARSSLWDVAGGQYPTLEYRQQMVAELQAPSSLWAGLFPTGHLAKLLDAACGDPVDVSVIDDDILVIGLIAIAAHQLPRRPDVWPTWAEHYDYLVTEFTKAQTQPT